jgi:hypothetical protein
VLVWRSTEFPGGGQADFLASTLETMLLAHPDFDDVTVMAEMLPPSMTDTFFTLLDHYYGWTDRAQRLSQLDAGWDYVVIADDYWTLGASVELYFAAVSRLADEIRAHGATPILLSEVNPIPAPDENGQLCSNTCRYQHTCSDGGEGSVWLQACAFGSNCSQCGPRDPADAPAEGPDALLWRVAVGTGSVLVSVPSTSSNMQKNAAAIQTALFGEDASATGYVPPGHSPETWGQVTAELHDRFVTDHATTHYAGPARTVVRVSEMVPSSTYRFMVAGTSSEAGYRQAMNALLAREGWPYDSVSLGSCSGEKHVTAACGDAALDHLLQEAFQSLYARGYDIPASEITGSAPDFMAQIYDRHWDATDDGGILALDTIYHQSYPIVRSAIARDLAWLPMRVAFGDLKIAFPDAQLLSDGVHATSAVQAGLAAMSYVSRTGYSPAVDGLDPETAFAVANGERLVRTIATLSRTGLPLADTPENRVVVATP